MIKETLGGFGLYPTVLLIFFLKRYHAALMVSNQIVLLSCKSCRKRKQSIFEPTCALCMVGSYASLSVHLSGLDQKSHLSSGIVEQIIV